MGLSMKVSWYDTGKCPHCGQPIKGTLRDWADSNDRYWYAWLEHIGYCPRVGENRTPDEDWYGKDMTLTAQQVKELAEYAKAMKVFNWIQIDLMVKAVLEYGGFIVINADW